MTARWFESAVARLLRSELAELRRERAEERRYWAAQVARERARADKAEAYARALTDRVLERRAGIQPVTVEPRMRPAPPNPDIDLFSPNSNAPLAAIEARIQQMELDGEIKYGASGLGMPDRLSVS